jgi:sulfite reductase (NADPH) hemoprotein beta-component
VAEIGLIGTAYGKYNLHIGGDREGMRLNEKFRDNLDEPAILETLDTLFADYVRQRNEGEGFGDYAFRKILPAHA